MYKICFIPLVMLLLFACKNENKKNDKKLESHDVKPEAVIVSEASTSKNASITFFFKLKKDDRIQLFFKSDSSGFENKDSFKRKVKGDWSSQKVIFNFDTEAIPAYLRFDFGEKEEQEIEIEKIILKSNLDTLEIPQKDIFTLFNLNGWVDFSAKNKGKFKALKKDNRFDPKLIFNKATTEKLKAL